jgi:hypothetical protein
MEDNNAIPISKSGIFAAIQDLKESREEESEEIKKEKKIAGLATTEGWQELKKIIEARIESVLSFGREVNPELSVEAIGFKYIASSLIAEELRNIINIVEQVYDSIQRRNQERGEEK